MSNSNFNTNTIKQKFMNILFEPEDDEEEYVDNSTNEIKKNVKVEPKPSNIKATDILYGKKDGDGHSNAFIDLNEITKEPPNLDSSEKYVSSPNISPIFGNIDENRKIKKSSDSKTVNTAYVDKPSSSYLGMVLSPIYGYDSVNENDDRDINSKEVKDIDITEDLGDIFATEEYKLSLDDDKDLKENSTFSSFYKREDE